MFRRGLSLGVTSGRVSNTLGFDAKAGSLGMRLRLFERLGRLVSWRPGWPGAGGGRPGDSRGDGADVGGRHRRSVGAGPWRPPPRAAQPPPPAGRQRPPAPAMQPPAGLPRRSPQAGPGPRASNGWAGGPARPPLPRNYSPAAGAAAPGGGGIGRARIREAPQFGAAPVETATRGREGVSQPPAAASRQPWYQVVGESAGAARAGLSAGQGAGQARHRRPGEAAGGVVARPGGGARPAGSRPGQGGAAVRRPAPPRPPRGRRRSSALRSA